MSNPPDPFPGLDLPLPSSGPEEEIRALIAVGNIAAAQRLLEARWEEIALDARPLLAGEVHAAGEAAKPPTIEPTPLPRNNDPLGQALDGLALGEKINPTERLLLLCQEFRALQTRLAQVRELVGAMAAEDSNPHRMQIEHKIVHLLTVHTPAHIDAAIYLRRNYRNLIRNRERARRGYTPRADKAALRNHGDK